MINYCTASAKCLSIHNIELWLDINNTINHHSHNVIVCTGKHNYDISNHDTRKILYVHSEQRITQMNIYIFSHNNWDESKDRFVDYVNTSNIQSFNPCSYNTFRCIPAYFTSYHTIRLLERNTQCFQNAKYDIRSVTSITETRTITIHLVIMRMDS